MKVGIFGYSRDAWERITAHRDYSRIALQGRARNDAEFGPIIFIDNLHSLALMENDLRDNPPQTWIDPQGAFVVPNPARLLP